MTVTISINALRAMHERRLAAAEAVVLPILERHFPENVSLSKVIAQLIVDFQISVQTDSDTLPRRRLEFERSISDTEGLENLLAALHHLVHCWNELINIQRVTLMDNMGGDDRVKQFVSELQNMEAAGKKTIAQFQSHAPRPQRPPRDDTLLLFSTWDVLKPNGIQRKPASRFLADLLFALRLPARSAQAIEQTLRNRKS